MDKMFSNKQNLETFLQFLMLMFCLVAYFKRVNQLAHENKTQKFPHNWKLNFRVCTSLKQKSFGLLCS